MAAAQTRVDQVGQHLAEAVAEHEVGDAVEGRGLAVEDRQRGAGPERVLGERRRRVDAERRADGEEHVGTLGRALRSHQVLGHEVLAERDRRRLQHPAALEARGILLAGAHPRQRVLHRAAPAALQALRLVHGAVDLDDDRR